MLKKYRRTTRRSKRRTRKEEGNVVGMTQKAIRRSLPIAEVLGRSRPRGSARDEALLLLENAGPIIAVLPAAGNDARTAAAALFEPAL